MSDLAKKELIRDALIACLNMGEKPDCPNCPFFEECDGGENYSEAMFRAIDLLQGEILTEKVGLPF